VPGIGFQQFGDLAQGANSTSARFKTQWTGGVIEDIAIANRHLGGGFCAAAIARPRESA
jgi:hypothetical protein